MSHANPPLPDAAKHVDRDMLLEALNACPSKGFDEFKPDNPTKRDEQRYAAQHRREIKAWAEKYDTEHVCLESARYIHHLEKEIRELRGIYPIVGKRVIGDPSDDMPYWTSPTDQPTKEAGDE